MFCIRKKAMLFIILFEDRRLHIWKFLKNYDDEVYLPYSCNVRQTEFRFRKCYKSTAHVIKINYFVITHSQKQKKKKKFPFIEILSFQNNCSMREKKFWN